jgi:molybdopterin-binding protein
MLPGSSAAQRSPRNTFVSKVKSIRPEGTLVRVEMDCGFALAALLTRQACEELNLRADSEVLALVKAPQVHLISRD